ncbi:MAG TPA: M20 family metallopeptidase [Dehalococcoidia bacterium]|nr:M20 family metallopeptidase [Dehalococcoidia bacterium]
MTEANGIKSRAVAEIDARRDALIDLSLRIHGTPEIAFQEHASSAMLADFLEAEGFGVERGICELPTAFRATFGSGEPRIAFVAEYDALPGIGHGCGHNIIGTAAAAAGIALKGLLQADGGGTVLVIGTPAEEAAGGKVYMVTRGAFNDVDCALMIHPGNRNTSVAYALACLELDIEFRGRAAHAAARPEAGVNALDAMVMAFSALGLMRQQIRDTARVHGIITDGGAAVNVIPDRTAAKLLVRTEEDDYMDEVLKPKVLACFEGAAQATGCTLNYKWGEESRYKTMRTNMTLAEAYRANIEGLGRVTMMPESKRSMGSTDMGNVSQAVPGIHPAIAIAPQNIPIHTEEFRELAKSEDGHAGLMDGAKALAMTGVDVLLDPDLRRRMKEEFEGSGRGAGH